MDELPTGTPGPAGYKPSEVNLFQGFPPLVATFGKTEAECAAFYLVRTLAVRGDAWRPLRWTEISEYLREVMSKFDVVRPSDPTTEDMFVKDLVTNPFARPDFHKLVSGGYARWLGEDGEPNRPLELTDHGFERLQRWIVRK